ncbi:MAG: 3-isopropylmalate dehydratase small subunit [Armatimonadetes bacterium]|nr:3-isopropylmalate dehydratase small subunit [Armatimonadota bacterium]MDW8122474.1 3-isopropylmalate dehydratase small subunit [Armatimonadota bacterium]
MDKVLRGKAHKFGDDINTDVIIPARYLVTTDPQELAQHCMEAIDPDFPKRARPGDFLVAGYNFGCGSSREHAPLSIKGLGIPCVIAKSFSRIFYRNCFNIGLAALECPELVDATSDGDELEVDIATGTITNVTKGKTFQSSPVPEFMREILEAGGLIPYIRKRLFSQTAPGPSQ